MEATEGTGRQATLFPKKPKPPQPIDTDVWIPVAELPDTDGIVPDAQFIENVRQVGIFSAIVLRKTKLGYEIVDGRRRLETARRLGLETIRCDIYPMSARTSAIMTLVANFQRSSNPPSELQAMERLLKRKGVTAQLIADQLGIPIQTVEKRLKLKALVPGLRAGFDAYKIAVTVAEAAARLEVPRQEDLVRLFEEKGKLTLADVNAQLEVRKKEAADMLPADMFKQEKPEIVKVEREHVEKAAEAMAYAADALKSSQDHVALVGELEALARAFRVLAAE